MGFPVLGMEYIFGGNSSLYIIFNASLEETVGSRSCEIGSEIQTEPENVQFQWSQIFHRL
jgi:hypothetical protein